MGRTAPSARTLGELWNRCDDEYLTTYGDPARDEWIAVVLPRLRQVPTATLVKATGLSRSAIKNIKGGAVPHASNRAALRKIASTLDSIEMRRA